MGKGFLKIQTVTANGAVLVGDASITITNEGNQILYELHTDETGNAPEVMLEAPDKLNVENPGSEPRYYMYNVLVRAPGYTTAVRKGVMIYDTTTSILKTELSPLVIGQEHNVNRMYIGGHKLDNPVETPQQLQVPQSDDGFIGIVPKVLPEVTIPNFIRVHLGRRERPSTIVSVPYMDYIKNVASHEIFDAWPEEAIIANVYCIISLTLNRVYTEFYRKQGYNFDITSETYMDQRYVHGGIVGARISAIVDRIFNIHLAIVGHKEPFLALYNDGVTVNIPGRLSQWGSFYDARDRGMTAWQIINKYFSQNLELRTVDRFGGVLESYPGYTLAQGTRGDAVRTMQVFLNRILGRHIPNFNPIITNGEFGPQTRNAVMTMQGILGLPQTGVIDRRTWYDISKRYATEKALWEMYSEGQRIGIGTTPPTKLMRPGDTGSLVTELQFLLDFIAMYHSEIPFVAQTSRFDSLTTEGVRAFQRLFGITIDGIVGATTWRKLYDVYWGIMQNAVPPQPPPPGPPPGNIPPFPGVSLRVGSTGQSVRLVQEAINRLAEVTPGLWRIAEDGIFGNGTRDAVMAFQRIFGLAVDGIVGVNTWRRLMEEAYSAGGPTQPEIPPFPGTNLGVGSTGQNVRLVQEAINKIAPNHPGRLWILAVDGNFGNMTRDAIFAFQSIFGLPITGVVNQATWDRLMQEAYGVSPGPTPPPVPSFPGTNLGVGSAGQNVRLVQEAINKIAPNHPGRLWILAVDGNFGNMTRDAIFAFQSIFGLPITGVVNQATWDRLMQEAINIGRG